MWKIICLEVCNLPFFFALTKLSISIFLEVCILQNLLTNYDLIENFKYRKLLIFLIWKWSFYVSNEYLYIIFLIRIIINWDIDNCRKIAKNAIISELLPQTPKKSRICIFWSWELVKSRKMHVNNLNVRKNWLKNFPRFGIILKIFIK